uniref:formate C-acetyltransferase n=1 Tax=Stygiella incarcerata TaxID=1712417 RepID=A0A192ZJ81_9EUKA|nr:pyruvate formate lyase [Stygiella incarcerata]|eukprot:TRINITY_DN29_c0_g1_i1.p1 TRINITY_DN29_c0_g1~~TRINITY_DN29_c0_g1_i1.p1  ORF type:complete len:727 (-),score=175.15 TRINITY_DN29_c0_g1_i1:213-2393(-)
MEINVAKFVEDNYTPFDGSEEFLEGPTDRTTKVWEICKGLLKTEVEKGILDVDTKTPSLITAFPAGYIDRENEVVVGLQTDAPLKRAIKPYGGWRMVKAALEAYGYEMDPEVEAIFAKYRKTHNDGVFDAYSKEIKVARSNHILTGLPDGYGRGRIIGDYRRLALYGADTLIAAKKQDLLDRPGPMTEDLIRLREEVSEQIRALAELKEMALTYGLDVSKPASNALEATQWVYFAYLASVKEQDGAAMSMGRIDAFLDIYFEKDLKEGKITEKEAQEIIDQFIIKLRLVRHLRTPAYNELFAGDPTWVTCVLGGVGCKGHMVTKTAFRMLHSLYNLGPSPEPNITVLWSKVLPESFQRFCSRVSIETSSIQYENDELMTPRFGCDYGIACCVSAMSIGKQMQFFGARCNLPKLLLYALNGGRDEVSGVQVAPVWEPLADGPLVFEDVKARFEKAVEWLAALYVNAMNVIHYMHDRYCYERIQMAFHDTDVHRFLAFGVAGLSIIADSFSAMKYAKVTPIRDERGIAVDFKIEGDFPKFGNDDDRVDEFAKWAVQFFTENLKKHKAYRDSEHTLSVLTITSNVVYGKATGSTPDGRKIGEAFAPGANPMHGRDSSGAFASLNSVAKIPYEYCLDGISNTFSTIPSALGKSKEDQIDNLRVMISGYFDQKAHHLNVNVLQRAVLEDAIKHPENYPQLTIRVSGYAVNFIRLTPEQQKEVIARTFHETM